MDDTLPILVIPAYNPDDQLIRLLEEHSQLANGQQCIIVNDGSKASTLSIFQHVADLGYLVLHHQHNLGKGAALKTAMNYYLQHFAHHSPGIITADADGQHGINDIIRLSQAFAETPDHLFLGTRQIAKKDIPLRSRIGNIVTRVLFNFITKNKVRDTQTGLRAIPKQLIQQLILSKTSRYEFEFEMFFIAKKHQFKVSQIPIETIYIDNNKSSHFNPLFDSLRIYFIFIRFCSSSILSFMLDFSAFTLLYQLTNDTAWSMIAARMLSVPFNFILNRHKVFKSNNNWFISLGSYLSLALVIGFSSYAMMNLIHHSGTNIYLSKICAEFMIFLINFLIQYCLVFTRRTQLAGAN